MNPICQIMMPEPGWWLWLLYSDIGSQCDLHLGMVGNVDWTTKVKMPV